MFVKQVLYFSLYMYRVFKKKNVLRRKNFPFESPFLYERNEVKTHPAC